MLRFDSCFTLRQSASAQQDANPRAGAATLGLAIAVIAAAAFGCGGGPSEGGGGGGGDASFTPAPVQVVASQDLADRVALSWEIPSGGSPARIVVLRDGEELAALEGSSKSFDDSTASPGELGELTEAAATSLVDLVRLTWSAPEPSAGPNHGYEIVADYGARGRATSDAVEGHRAAPAVEGYRVERDGAELAQLPASATEYDDTAASPGTAPDVAFDAVVADQDAIQLSWAATGAEPGPTYAYRVKALSSTDIASSETLDASRAPPTVLGWSLFRDGVLLASLGGFETSFDDRTATPVDLGPLSLSLEEGEASVALHWTPETTSAGAIHTYEIRAETEVGERASEPARASRLAPEIHGYRILRDGNEIALGDADATGFDDIGATAGRLDAPSALEASSGTTFDGVELHWQPALAHPGETHRYQVIAVAAEGVEAESNEVSGARTAPSIAYEIQRDADDWFAVGSETSFLDEDAPRGTVEAEATALADRMRSFVELGLHAPPTVTPPSPSTYRVRAVGLAHAGDPSLPAVGVRKVGTSFRTFWQRSTADADADYADLPGLEFDPSLDLDPVLGEGRHYRARFEGEGIAGVSLPAWATAHGFVSVSAGRMRTCGLRDDGAAVCWGLDSFGEAPSSPPPHSFTSVSAGGYHTCGVRTDGKVVCWGTNEAGQAPTNPTTDSFTSVSAGFGHTCGIRADGRMVCWGHNSSGQAPRGPSVDLYTSVSAGSAHTCAIRTDGRLFCWGDNPYGQAPAEPSQESFSSVGAGHDHTCAVRADGKVLCWGSNRDGQAPRGPSADSFTSVVSSREHTCGIRTDGKLVCWGNVRGQAPTAPTEASFTSVALGESHTCGVRTDGKVECWGFNLNGQAPPRAHLERFSGVAVGSDTFGSGAHTCGVRQDGKVVCWGRNADGQAPPQPSSDTFTKVGSGERHSCGLRVDGKVVCWGFDGEGRAPPQPSVETFSSISVGRAHNCGIRTDGKVVCWGYDAQGQAPSMPSADSFTSVSAGYSHSCGVRVDGKVLCWGDDQYGQAPRGPSADAFSSVSAGDGFTCGVRLDGKAVCWGSYTPFDAPSTPSTDSFTSVSAGRKLACGVRSDGTATCWGEPFPQPIPPASTPFSTLSVGAKEACGIRADGQLFCWGNNTYQQAPTWSAAP